MDLGLLSADPAAPLCPLENRRTKAEFLVKLFVVHFMAIAAFCHLLNLRNESILNWRLYVFVLVPYAFLAHQALAVIPILFAAPMLASSRVEFLEISTTLLKIVFGKVHGRSRRVSAEEGGIGQNRPLRLRDNIELWLKKIAHALAALAFLFQCVATIVLYIRRRQYAPDAITFVDQRIFELAIGGVLIGLLTLGIALDCPILKDSAPNPKSGPEAIVAWLADRPEIPLPAWEEVRAYLPIRPMWAGTVSLMVTWIMGNFEIIMTLEPPITIWVMSETDSTTYLPEAIVGSIFSLVTLAMIIWMLYTDTEYNGMRTNNGQRNFCTMFCNLLMFILVLGIILLFMVEFAAGLVPVGVAAIRQYVRLFTQVNALQSWPQDVACPMLWQDQLDNQIWWLA